MKPWNVWLILLVSAGLIQAAEGQKPARPVERERRIETERREREQRERERRIEANEPRQERVETSVLRLDRVEVLRDFIASAPEHREMKGWRNEIMDFAKHFEGKSASEREIKEWMEANIRGGTLERNKFKGALREVSDVILLQAEGYREVTWNKQKERVTVDVGAGQKVELSDRIIDIIALRPDGQRVFIETKNADLTRVPYKREVELLASRTSVQELARYCSRPDVSVSREFTEMVKDIWLAQSQGRTIEWKANAARNDLGYHLRQYGIELHVYH